MLPYCHQIGQELSVTDLENRVAFAQRCKEKLKDGPDFSQRRVFFEELSFSLQDAVNKQNCRI